MWNNLWSVSRYVMGPLSGRWRQSGNDLQCLAAPIWKYRSGFGDHRFNFFIDLRSNYTFYTNLTNIVHWVVAYRDVAHLVRLNLGKSLEKSAKSFDAGLNDTIVWYHTTSGLRAATWKYKTLLCSYFAQLNDIVLRYASTLLANDEEYILFCIYNINFCVTDISLLMLCVLWNVKRLCFWFNRDIHNLALYT